MAPSDYARCMSPNEAWVCIAVESLSNVGKKPHYALSDDIQNNLSSDKIKIDSDKSLKSAFFISNQFASQ
jgi:hypothetical protein